MFDTLLNIIKSKEVSVGKISSFPICTPIELVLIHSDTNLSAFNTTWNFNDF